MERNEKKRDMFEEEGIMKTNTEKKGYIGHVYVERRDIFS